MPAKLPQVLSEEDYNRAGRGQGGPELHDQYVREAFASRERFSPSVDPVTIDPRAYDVDPLNEQQGLRDKFSQSSMREGAQIDNRAADDALSQQFLARGRQQESAGLYGATAMGIGPSAAQEQMKMALDAQTQAAARQGGARAIGASTGGYGAMSAQGAAGRQGEVQQAYQGGAQNLVGMRRADIGAMRQSQEASYAQAQFDAGQRARNDAMARTYLGQANDLKTQQLGADQAYEGQLANNIQGVMGVQNAAKRLKDEKTRHDVGLGLSGASAAFSGGATYLGKGGG